MQSVRSRRPAFRLVAAAVVAVGALTVSLLPSGSASAAPRTTPVISMTTSTTSLAYGKQLTVQGAVQNAGKPLAGARVKVVGKNAGTGLWEQFGAVQTAGNGSWSFAFTPRSGYRIKAEMASTASTNAAASASRDLAVQPQLYGVSPGASSLAVVDRDKIVSGSVQAQLSGKRVKLARADGRVWTDVATARFDATGHFDLKFRTMKEGSPVYRVIIPSQAGLVMKMGANLTFDTKPSLLALQQSGTACYGVAAAVDRGCVNPALTGLITPTTDAARLRGDTGGAYDPNCWQSQPETLLTKCSYGSTDPSALRIALVGDSHAAGYGISLRGQLVSNKWKLDTYLGVSCRWMVFPSGHGCEARARDVDKKLKKGDYDVIIDTGLRQAASDTPENASAVARQREQAWAPLIAQGVKIVAIADHPYLPSVDTLSCVSTATGTDALGCSAPQAASYKGIDPLFEAVRDTPGAVLVDPTRYMCWDGTCPLVVGNVVVYRDRHHLSGTFAQALGPYIAYDIKKAIAR